MSKMAFDILLECMEHTECAEICAMASAKLHALVQTRMASTKEENAYLIFRLAKLIQKSLAKSDLQGDALDHFAYLAPVMRALLEKSRFENVYYGQYIFLVIHETCVKSYKCSLIVNYDSIVRNTCLKIALGITPEK